MSSAKNIRVLNFTNSEKEHLLRIIANKFAATLEDKKRTDPPHSNRKKPGRLLNLMHHAVVARIKIPLV